MLFGRSSFSTKSISITITMQEVPCVLRAESGQPDGVIIL